jgi:glycosyltransferase involved in cell wall biosynthesis
MHSVRYTARHVAITESLKTADAVFVQRGLYPLGPGLLARSLERFDGRVVFDLDDAVFSLKPALARRGKFARWLYGPQQAERILKRADAVVVSSVELANALPSWVTSPQVLPTVPDPARYPIVQHQESSRIVVGWAGTVGNMEYLEPLRDVFRTLRDRGQAELEIVSSEPWNGPARFHRWTLDNEASLFNRFSIGIMPLPDTDYTRAKAGFKLLQYMASGLPVVASPIGVNRELVEASGSGFLASTAAEWETALVTLCRDAQLRAEFGRNGRAFVERYVNLDAQAETLTGLLVSKS